MVGNECLNKKFTDKPITVSQLIADIKYVRNGLKNKGTVKVTTALDYESAMKYGAELKPHVDSMMMNIYPFFGPVAIGDAVANLISAYDMFNKMFGGKQVIIGETGWPSAGDDNGPAKPGIENEATFIRALYPIQTSSAPPSFFPRSTSPGSPSRAHGGHTGVCGPRTATPSLRSRSERSFASIRLLRALA